MVKKIEELKTTLSHSRTVNLGNYNSIHIGIQKEYSGNIDITQTYRDLIQIVEQELTKRYQEPPADVTEKINNPIDKTPFKTEPKANTPINYPTGKKSKTEFITICTFKGGCGAEITMVKQSNNKWKPFLNNQPHRCQQ